MITTTVPAQITSVEDKITGNLSLLQVVLLIAPVCISTVLIVIFPPNMKIAAYKIIIAFLVGFTSVTMSIRWKDELIIQRFLKLLYFYKRPSIYLSTVAPPCSCSHVMEEDRLASDSQNMDLIQKRRPLNPAELISMTESFEKNNKGFVTDKEGNLSAIIGFKA